VAPLVERIAAFCRSTLDRNIAFEVHGSDSGVADIDASLIEQAVLNLLINARDALADGAPAAPTIKVFVESVGAGAPELDGRRGDFIAIRVEDNGVGMDAATMQRMYEPFFTTKPIGKGTGLGLSTTQTIVRDHGGFIACRSALGRGTTFTLLIPRGMNDRPRASGEGSDSTAPGTPGATAVAVAAASAE
jgi:signal transduction histidine kinase